MSELTTAIIYLRVSSDAQEREGLSLDTQLNECRRYAVRHGWSLAPEMVDVMSGLKDHRPAYQEMLQTIRTLRAQSVPVVVVVAALDRFGRRLIERVRSREELHALGVPLHSVREGGEVSDLAANILAAVAQEESRRTGERVHASRVYVTERGWSMPGKPPFGYHRRPATADERRAGAPHSVLELDEATAPYMREVFERVARGESIRTAWDWLVRALPAAVRGERRLPFSVVAHGLRRAVYVARPAHGDADVLARPVGKWPALIDDELYARVQVIIDGHLKLPHQATGGYTLTGLIRCPMCGGRMTGFGPKQRWTFRRYRCNEPQKSRTGRQGACAWSCSAKRVEAAVLLEVRTLLADLHLEGRAGPVALRRAWRALQQPGDLAVFREKREADLSREVQRARERLTKASLMFVDGELDRPAYDAVRAQVESDLRQAETELAKLAGRAPAPRGLPALDLATWQITALAAALDGAEPPELRQMLAAFIVRATPIRLSGYAQYGVQIEWTGLGAALKAAGAAIGQVEGETRSG